MAIEPHVLRIKWDDPPYTYKDLQWRERPDRIEHVKEEEMPVTKLYKALRVKPDGSLASLLIGNTTHLSFASFKELTYKEGEITYAPEGSRGIYCDKTLEQAEQRAKVESREGRAFESVVLEVTPLGRQATGSDCICCPAVLVGRKVYGIAYSPPEPPKEEWKDVTSECTTRLSICRPAWITLCHDEKDIALFGGKGIEEFGLGKVARGLYRITRTPVGGSCYNECGGFKVERMKKISV